MQLNKFLNTFLLFIVLSFAFVPAVRASGDSPDPLPACPDGWSSISIAGFTSYQNRESQQYVVGSGGNELEVLVYINKVEGHPVTGPFNQQQPNEGIQGLVNGGQVFHFADQAGTNQADDYWVAQQSFSFAMEGGQTLVITHDGVGGSYGSVDYNGVLCFKEVEEPSEPTPEPTEDPTDEPTPEPTDEPTPEPVVCVEIECTPPSAFRCDFTGIVTPESIVTFTNDYMSVGGIATRKPYVFAEGHGKLEGVQIEFSLLLTEARQLNTWLGHAFRVVGYVGDGYEELFYTVPLGGIAHNRDLGIFNVHGLVGFDLTGKCAIFEGQPSQSVISSLFQQLVANGGFEAYTQECVEVIHVITQQ